MNNIDISWIILGFVFIIVVFPGFGKFLLYIIAFPYFLWRWNRKRYLTKTRRHNYEMLGNYISIFAGHSDILKHLRKLIEDGISEPEFQALLDTNLKNLTEFEVDKEKKVIRAKLEEEIDFKKMAIEQQELLIQSKLSLEQIKFREKLLDNLYKKMQEKYKIE